MGLLDSVCQGAWKTKLRAELALLDREISRKEALFGVEFFTMISAYKNAANKNLPSICDFVTGDFVKTATAVKLLQDEKEIKLMKIRINRTSTDDEPPESLVSDKANEAMLRLQMHSLDRDILKRKEEFGTSLSRDVAEKARFWSSEGLSVRRANDMIAIRKLMEAHSRALLPVYQERDSKMREIHNSEGQIEESPQPTKQKTAKPAMTQPAADRVEYKSVTRLESYLERNKINATKDKLSVKTGKAKAPSKAPMKAPSEEKKGQSSVSKTTCRKQSVPVRQSGTRQAKSTVKKSIQNQEIEASLPKALQDLPSKELTGHVKSRTAQNAASKVKAKTSKQRESVASRQPLRTVPPTHKVVKKSVERLRLEI